jgi:hypothetical protein
MEQAEMEVPGVSEQQTLGDVSLHCVGRKNKLRWFSVSSDFVDKVVHLKFYLHYFALFFR